MGGIVHPNAIMNPVMDIKNILIYRIADKLQYSNSWITIPHSDSKEEATACNE